MQIRVYSRVVAVEMPRHIQARRKKCYGSDNKSAMRAKKHVHEFVMSFFVDNTVLQ